MRVTQKMIAERAGVDRSTVSYALSGRPLGTRISDAVVRRIRRIAREMDYVPNRHAQSLVTGRARAVALVVRALWGSGGGWLWSEVAEGAESALFEAGYRALLCRLDPDRPFPGQVARLVREGWADGVVALLWEPEDVETDVAERFQFPLVFISVNRKAGPRQVAHDATVGLREAVDHLYALGHRRLVWVDPLVTGQQGARGECVRAYAAGKGMHVRVVEVSLTGLDLSLDFPGLQVRLLADLRGALAGPLDATAVLCWNDFLAHAACAILRERGLRIPEDVSVVGFDDMQPSAHVPPLTTISGAWRELGAAAANLVLDLSQQEDPGAAPPPSLVPTRLVVRGSTAVALPGPGSSGRWDPAPEQPAADDVQRGRHERRGPERGSA